MHVKQRCCCVSKLSLRSSRFRFLRAKQDKRDMPALEVTKGILRNHDGDDMENHVKKAIGLMSKTTTLHVHHTFLCISFLSLHNYDVKWPNFKFTWERERQGNKFYHLCLNSGAVPSLQLQHQNSLILRNGANWDNREKVWKAAKSVFQRPFHGRRRCRILRSLKIKGAGEGAGNERKLPYPDPTSYFFAPFSPCTSFVLTPLGLI